MKDAPLPSGPAGRIPDGDPLAKIFATIRALHDSLYVRVARIETYWLLWLHATVSALAGVVMFAGWRRALGAATALPSELEAIDKQRYAPWIQPYYFPEHKYTILSLILTLMLLGAIVGYLALQLRHTPQEREARRKSYLVGLGIAGSVIGFLAANLVVGRRVTPADLLALSVVLGIGMLLALPRSLPTWRPGLFARKLGVALLLAQAVALCLLVTSGRVPFASDYLQVPSHLFIKSGKADLGKFVDTIDYINERRIWGNHLLPDVRRSDNADPPCLDGNRFDIKRNTRLENFVWADADRIYGNSHGNAGTFYFRRPTNELCFVGKLKPSDRQALANLAPDRADHIDAVAAKNALIWKEFEDAEPQPEELDFGRKNRLLFINFIHDLETMFHHHFQFLNPIKEHALGAPLAEIYSQYGLSFLLIEKLMSLAGGIDYPTFLNVMFGLQLLYILGLVGLTHLLFRSWTSTLVIAAVAVGCWIGLGFTTVLTGLGYGPVRHGLDLGVIGLFAWYLRSGRWLLLLPAVVVAAANMLLDRFVGGFMPIALAATLLLRGIADFGPYRLLELVLGAVLITSFGAGFLVIGGMTAVNPYVAQFMDGIWGFPVGSMRVIVLLVMVVAILGTTFWSINRSYRDSKFLVVLLAAYVVMFLFYWMILPNYGHLYKLFPVMALALIALWHECLVEVAPPELRRRLALVAIAVAGLFWMQMARNFLLTASEANSYFKSSRTFEWSNPRMQVRSTMDPTPFDASVRVLQSATKAGERVSILSEFDSILLFLSDRVSAMQHYELGTFLNSRKHVEKAIADLRARKPEVLIVDTCLQCSFVPYRLARYVPHLHPSYLKRSLEKVDRLQLLARVFEAVEMDYERLPGPSGSLVAVYRRKATMDTAAH